MLSQLDMQIDSQLLSDCMHSKCSKPCKCQACVIVWHVTIDTSTTVAAVVQGVQCGEQPYRVLAVCLLVVGVCCVGLLRFKVETNPQRLWVGAGSLAAKEKAQYEVTHRLYLQSGSSSDLPAAAASIIAGSVDFGVW